MTPRTLERIAFIVVGVLLVFSLAVTKVNSDRISRDAELGARTHAAVCVLRSYYGEQVQDTRDYLDAHPQGVPGISAAQIRISLARLTGVYRALADLKCL